MEAKCSDQQEPEPEPEPLGEEPGMQRMKDLLAVGIKMVDMDPNVYYLGLKADRDGAKRSIKLSQLVYIEKVLYRFGFLHVENYDG